MLFFALLLQTAPTEPDPTAPAFPRILDRAALDCAGGCDPARRYRLDIRVARAEDPKNRALRGEWQPCETTGAPVCPSKGRRIVRASFD